MDLELTDEQTMLSEALTTLLEREWLPAEAAHAATPRAARAAVGRAAGVLSTTELGAVELCLAARLFGAHLASTPFLGSAALRYAIGVSHARARGDRAARDAAVEHADEVDRFAVVGDADGVALVAAARRRRIEPAASLDVGIPLFTVTVRRRRAASTRDVARLTAIGALLAAAESVGAAERMLDDARAYAAERRQFGRTIGSYQALRHILADMYVRRASAWSTVLYAAAALDDESARRPADRGDREGLRGPRRARGRARRAAGLRRHRLHRGASGAPLPAAHRRARAAVRGRRAPRARARPGARRVRRDGARHDRDRLQRPDRATARAHQHRRRPGGRRPAARRRPARPALAATATSR